MALRRGPPFNDRRGIRDTRSAPSFGRPTHAVTTARSPVIDTAQSAAPPRETYAAQLASNLRGSDMNSARLYAALTLSASRCARHASITSGRAAAVSYAQVQNVAWHNPWTVVACRMLIRLSKVSIAHVRQRLARRHRRREDEVLVRPQSALPLEQLERRGRQVHQMRFGPLLPARLHAVRRHAPGPGVEVTCFGVPKHL